MLTIGASLGENSATLLHHLVTLNPRDEKQKVAVAKNQTHRRTQKQVQKFDQKGL